MPANIYKLQSGEIVPGVTTICNILDKPQLIDWAWKLGQQGKDWREQRDNAGDIGTLTHDCIMKFLTGEVFTIPNETVGKCFNKFLNWWWEQTRGQELELIVEQPLVSERFRFGGQPDIFVVNWKRRIDIKTSGGIYESHWLQLGGYDILGAENGQKAKEHQILWLPKDDRFDAPIRTDLRKEKMIFRHLLEIYKLRRECGS
jgi:hypothetical protein